jgi:hypothetical protein
MRAVADRNENTFRGSEHINAKHMCASVQLETVCGGNPRASFDARAVRSLQCLVTQWSPGRVGLDCYLVALRERAREYQGEYHNHQKKLERNNTFQFSVLIVLVVSLEQDPSQLASEPSRP